MRGESRDKRRRGTFHWLAEDFHRIDREQSSCVVVLSECFANCVHRCLVIEKLEMRCVSRQRNLE